MEVIGVDRIALGLPIGGMGHLRFRPLLPIESQPAQILLQGSDIGFITARMIGIFDAQQEYTPLLGGVEGVEQRGAHIAEVQPAGRAWCKSRFDRFVAGLGVHRAHTTGKAQAGQNDTRRAVHPCTTRPVTPCE